MRFFQGLCLLWVPALLLAGDVETDFDPKTDFSVYKTYSFITGVDLTKRGMENDTVVRERLRNFISGVLDLNGTMQEVPPDEPHKLVIRYWTAMRQKQDVSVTSVGIGGSYGYPYWGGYPPYWGGVWGWSYEEYVVNNYIDGTLIVDLIDKDTKQLVWRTFLRQKIEDRAKAYEQARKKLMKAFEAYPPSPSAKKKMAETREKYMSKYPTIPE